MLGRATITLGIGPHSSKQLFQVLPENEKDGGLKFAVASYK